MEYALFYSFGFYIATLAGITSLFYRKNTSEQEFMLGNRSLNYLATAIAAHSSDMSIWLFMGFPGIVYIVGPKEGIWVIGGLIIGMYCSWTFMAAQLRTATAQYKSITLSEYLEHRFDDKSGLIRLVAAFFALLFFVFYISSGLVGMGRMFESVFNINYHVGITVSLAAAIAYTFFGGFVGIAWCDLFQGLFLLLMILIVPLFGYASLQNGTTDISTYAQIKNISLSLIPESFTNLFTSLLVACGWGLGYFGQPHILISFMGIKDTASVTKARTVGIVWQTLTLGAALSIGLIGIAFFPAQLANPELVFVAMVQQLFTPFFAGFVLCAIIAAGLTTVDTQILVAASIFATDVYKQLINPKASSQKILSISRLGIIVIPLISLAIASTNSNSVFGLVAFAWNGLGSTFGPVLLAALYSRHAKKHAVLTGMIVGGIIATLWPLTGSSIPAMIPAFFTNLTIILLGSRLIK